MSSAGANRPTDLVSGVAATLGVSNSAAEAIVVAFERFVAEPLEQNLERVNAHTLATRNPMIYTARGATTVDEWVDRVLEDRETSAFEGHLGTWQEEVARIVSEGFKPGSGVDLQLERPGVVELYAIQSAQTQRALEVGAPMLMHFAEPRARFEPASDASSCTSPCCPGGVCPERSAPIRISSSSPRMSSGSA